MDGTAPSIEQLWAALDGAAGARRIEVLLELNQRLGERGDVAEALSVADEAVREAEGLGDELFLAEAAMARGKALFSQGEYVQAAHAHARAAAAARAALNGQLAGTALMLAGDAQGEGEDQAAALASFTAAEQEFLAVEDTAAAGRAAFFAGRVLWRVDRSTDALEVLARSRAHWRAAGVPAAVAEVDDLTASALLDLGRHGEAVGLLRSVLHVVQALSDGDLPYAQHRLGMALRLAGSPTEGLELLRTAEAGYRDREDLAALGRTVQEQARCCWDLRQVHEAFALLERARALLDACGRDEAVLGVDSSRAIWLHSVGDFDQAVQVNDTIAAAAPPVPVYWALVRKVDNLRVAGRAQDCLEALDQLEAYLGAHEELDGIAEAGGRLWRTALYARALLDVDQPDLARDAATAALALVSDGDDPEFRAWVHDVLAHTGRTAALFDSADGADGPDQDQDRALAIALYLAAGDHERARHLSGRYLPSQARGGAQTE